MASVTLSVGESCDRMAGRAVATPPQRVGSWDLVELLSDGRLATVFRARPATAPVHRPANYAVKILKPHWQRDSRVIGLFFREATVGRSVASPHLISILSASVSRPPYYLVMPWLPGHTLKARLDCQEVLEIHTSLSVARQAAIGLDALHRAGWTHGDVKPDNLLISPEGHVTLLDLAFARRDTDHASVVNRAVLGPCGYMAPEVLTSTLRVDIRSDIYSLGAVLYHALSGRLPYQAADLADLASQHRRWSPPPLGRLAPHVPEDVASLVQRMLAKEPLRRPQTPAELVGQLARLEIDALARYLLD